MADVRMATSEDREFILGLAKRLAIRDLPPWRTAEEIAAGTRYRLEEALDGSAGPSSFLVAVSEEGIRLGFAWMVLIRDWYTLRNIAKLEELAVTQDGQGTGAMLMGSVEAWARERGCELLVLNVLVNNARARRLYARHGFRDEHTLMTKDLR